MERGQGGAGWGGAAGKTQREGGHTRRLTTHPSSCALKGGFQPAEGSRASMQSRLSGQGWLIPERGHTFQSFPSKLARQTRSRGLRGSRGSGWGECYWDRAPPLEDLRSAAGSSSCLTGPHDHLPSSCLVKTSNKQSHVFPYEPCTL